MGFHSCYSETSRIHSNKTKLHREKEGIRLGFYPHYIRNEDIISQNSVLLHDLCRRNYQLHVILRVLLLSKMELIALKLFTYL
jgi:hypothetical protein